MKNIYILLLFILGAAVIAAGAWLKYENSNHARTVLGIGLAIEGYSLFLLIMKKLKGNDNSKGFLDS